MLASGIAVRRSLGALGSMRRREFITCLAGMAAMRPLVTNAAGEKVWRVGLLSNSPPPSAGTKGWRDQVLLVLTQSGFSPGRNLEMVERYSEGDADRLPLLAREINASGVDAIVATSM